MGPGHLGVGFAAKAVAPKAPLWALLVASEFPDLLCAGMMATGVESQAEHTISLRDGVRIQKPARIPYSHGLVMNLVWAVVIAAVARRVWRDRQVGIALGATSFSHWLLDFLVHTPDLPLGVRGSRRVGLGLWGSGLGLVVSGVLEVLLLACGISRYVAVRRQGRAGALDSRP